MPEFPGRLRTPRLPSAPATPAVGEMYYNTAANTLYWWNGTLWVTAGTPRVTTLPGSPVDGQEVYYVADNTKGVLWHLRYNAAGGTYKWEFLGGSPMWTYVATNEATTQFNWTDLTTVGPTVTVALAGDYEAEAITEVYGNTGAQAITAPMFGTTLPPTDTAGAGYWMTGGVTGGDITISTKIIGTVPTAGQTIRMVYRQAGTASQTAGFLNRRLYIRPIRVG